MHIIIGMPPHIIIIGMPPAIMAIIRWQHSLNISAVMPSTGETLQTMASLVISQVIRMTGTGMGIGIMPPIIGIGIMPPIMGIGIMPPIIGMGIMPLIMGPGIIGIIPAGMLPVVIGVAGFIADHSSRERRF